MRGLFALLLCAFPIVSAILTFQIEPKQIRCFKQDLKRDEELALDFEVVRGGLLDIKIRLQGPNGANLIDRMVFFNKKTEKQIEEEGRVRYKATMVGLHEVCFDNRMSRWTSKVVSFHMQNENEKPPHEEVAKLEHLGPVVDSVINIADKVDMIEKVQHHMRVAERANRDDVTTINGRVQWLAMFESGILLSMSYYQVRTIRHWFTDSAGRGSGVVAGPARGRV